MLFLQKSLSWKFDGVLNTPLRRCVWFSLIGVFLIKFLTSQPSFVLLVHREFCDFYFIAFLYFFLGLLFSLYIYIYTHTVHKNNIFLSTQEYPSWNNWNNIFEFRLTETHSPNDHLNVFETKFYHQICRKKEYSDGSNPLFYHPTPLKMLCEKSKMLLICLALICLKFSKFLKNRLQWMISFTGNLMHLC